MSNDILGDYDWMSLADREGVVIDASAQARLRVAFNEIVAASSQKDHVRKRIAAVKVAYYAAFTRHQGIISQSAAQQEIRRALKSTGLTADDVWLVSKLILPHEEESQQRVAVHSYLYGTPPPPPKEVVVAQEDTIIDQLRQAHVALSEKDRLLQELADINGKYSERVNHLERENEGLKLTVQTQRTQLRSAEEAVGEAVRTTVTRKPRTKAPEATAPDPE